MEISEQYLQNFDLDYLDDLIDMFELHYSYPVNIEQVYDALNINRYYHLPLPAGCNGFSAMHRKGFGIAVFDRNLKGPALREVKFHELGHLLWHRSGSVHGSQSVSPLPGQELEADLVAAYLALPGAAVLELFRAQFTIQQVCGILGVTGKMLDLRCRLMISKNEFGIRDNPDLVRIRIE